MKLKAIFSENTSNIKADFGELQMHGKDGVDFLSKKRLTDLLNAANEATGVKDATLADAVARLISGYGIEKEETPKLTAPVIRLETVQQEVPKLDTPVIELVVMKLQAPVIELVDTKLQAPVIQFEFEADGAEDFDNSRIYEGGTIYEPYEFVWVKGRVAPSDEDAGTGYHWEQFNRMWKHGCDLEEHKHTEDCYGYVDGVYSLICGLEEHTHNVYCQVLDAYYLWQVLPG